MAIYTKTGDKGETKVFDKESGQLTAVRKDSCHIKTIGAIDELNSFLGIIKSRLENQKDKNEIEVIQENLFIINSILAGSRLEFDKNNTKKLEKQIDTWEGSLPVLKNFIFYGGSELSSLLFYARALVRRAERELTEFSQEMKVADSIKTYMNRLSDYIFMMARSENISSGQQESFWKTSK